MPTTIAQTLRKFLEYIPGPWRALGKMPSRPEFKATDDIGHRYQDPDALCDYLTDKLGFKNSEIVAKYTDVYGLQVQLPRKLTAEEKMNIRKYLGKLEDKKQKENAAHREGND